MHVGWDNMQCKSKVGKMIANGLGGEDIKVLRCYQRDVWIPMPDSVQIINDFKEPETSRRNVVEEKRG